VPTAYKTQLVHEAQLSQRDRAMLRVNECFSEIFSDMNYRAISLRQLSFLYERGWDATRKTYSFDAPCIFVSESASCAFIQDAISRIRYVRGTTNTDAAIRYVRTFVRFYVSL